MTQNPFIRIQAGYIAKKRGQIFEDNIELFCRMQKLSCIRLPNGCKTVGKNKLIRVKSPFDYIIGNAALEKIVFIDAKSLDNEKFPKSSVDPYQVYNLLSLSHCGANSGYLVYHRPLAAVYFYTASQLNNLETRASLDPKKDGINIGSIENLHLSKLFEVGKSEHTIAPALP